MSTGQNVAALAMADVSWLGRWRTLPGYEACVAEQLVWVRGCPGPAWSYLPALERYTEGASGRLFLADGRVPMRRMPEGSWMPISELLRIRPPVTILPAQHVAPVAWSLIVSTEFHEASLMVLAWPTFASWCLTTSSVRLNLLRFALSEDGRVCVTGKPLPPLPGDPWCLDKNVATPAGWSLPAGITATLVASAMQLAADEITLLHPDGTSERLPNAAFVKVSRGAIRASLRENF
ncbi:MAG: hypothetical protein OJI67_04795 [Prosthecobacter sp.]|nr:hypothetical protein [Prosthecobacter sp.]